MLYICTTELKTPYFAASNSRGLVFPLLWNKVCHWPFTSSSLSLSLSIGLSLSVSPALPCLPKAASNQQALSSQKGHSVPLMVFWFIPSSSLPSHPSLSPLFLTGKLESHYHQGAKKGLVPSAAEWRRPRSWGGGETAWSHGNMANYISKIKNGHVPKILVGVVSADTWSLSALSQFTDIFIIHREYFWKVCWA